MSSPPPNPNNARDRPPILHLALVYAGFAALWILLTDSAVAWLTADAARVTHISIIKGLVFVSVTTLLVAE